jgi:hypothetical protein
VQIPRVSVASFGFIFLRRDIEQNFEGVEYKDQTNCFEKKEQGQYLRTGNTIKSMVTSEVS